MRNILDFYILYPGHPRYESANLIEDDLIRIIIQKYEMIIFTIKGDVLGDPNFGASLEELLHTTLLSNVAVEERVRSQIDIYIPELQGTKYNLRVEFIQDNTDFREVMIIYFQIADYDVYSIFGERSMRG
jgi:phage baseplate assembly protein W